MGRAAYWDNRGSPTPQNPGCSEFGCSDWTTKIIRSQIRHQQWLLPKGTLVRKSAVNCKCGLPTGCQPSSFIPQDLHTCCSFTGNTLPKSLHGCHFFIIWISGYMSAPQGSLPGLHFQFPPSSLMFTLPCVSFFRMCHSLALSCPWLFMLSLPTEMQAPWTEV